MRGIFIKIQKIKQDRSFIMAKEKISNNYLFPIQTLIVGGKNILNKFIANLTLIL